MDRDRVGGRWSDGALWPLGLGTEGLWRGPASSSPVSGTRGPLPGGSWVETPPGAVRKQESGGKETGSRCGGRLSAPPRPEILLQEPRYHVHPSVMLPASCLLPGKNTKVTMNKALPTFPPLGWALPLSGSLIPRVWLGAISSYFIPEMV